MANKIEPRAEIKEGSYAKEDDVVIAVELSVPQPDQIEKKEYSVSRIKKEIVECEARIARYTGEKEQWEKILTDHEDGIKEAAK